METSHASLFEEFPHVLTTENIRMYAKDFKPKPPKSTTKNMSELLKLLQMKRSSAATVTLGRQWAKGLDKKLDQGGLEIEIEEVTLTVQLKIGDIYSMKLPKHAYTIGFASVVFGCGKSRTWDRLDQKTDKSQITALVIFIAQHVHTIEFILPTYPTYVY
jgi:hypothetical protein